MSTNPEATRSDTATMSADKIRNARFNTSFRGLDPHEVRVHLESVAKAYQAVVERETALRTELTTLREEQAASTVAEADASAVDAAPPAHQESEELLAAARAEADALVAAARNEASAVVSKANDEAARIILRARAESRGRPSSEAMAVVEAALNETHDPELAREQARLMISEARAVRERILTDLAKRRRVAHVQLEQMRVAREKLAETLREARRLVDDAARDLSTAEVEAKIAAESAGRRVGAEPMPTAQDLEAELLGSRHLAPHVPPVATIAAPTAEQVMHDAALAEAPEIEVAEIVDEVEVAEIVADAVDPDAGDEVDAGSMHDVLHDGQDSDDASPAGEIDTAADPAETISVEVMDEVIEGETIEGETIEGETIEDEVAAVETEEVVAAVDAAVEADTDDMLEDAERLADEAPTAEDGIEDTLGIDDTDGTDHEAVVIELRAHEPGRSPDASAPAADRPGEGHPERRTRVDRVDIDSLFARLRAEREQAAADARATLATDTSPDAAADTDVTSSVRTLERAPLRLIEGTGDDTDLDAGIDLDTQAEHTPGAADDTDAANVVRLIDLTVFDESPAPAPALHAVPDAAVDTHRDFVVGPLQLQLTRVLKRHLQDEQSAALAAVRRARTRGDLDAVLGSEPIHRSRLVRVVTPVVADAARAGADRAGRIVVDPEGAVEELVESVVGGIVDQLRGDVQVELARVASPESDASHLVDLVSGCYRRWTTERLTEATAGVLLQAYETGRA